MKISMSSTNEYSSTIHKLNDLSIKHHEYDKINIDDVNHIPEAYPDEFITFCNINNLCPPKISTKRGMALSVMLAHPDKYWYRQACDDFIKKFDIESKDSIQLFNKHSQWGISTNSGIERGRLYIILPYKLSTKHIMRKDFKFDGTPDQKNIEIEKIKSTIKSDYIDICNDQWHLGHKNPESQDSSMCNLVLQPPIQAKYRDQYIFIDTLTKIPTPKKLISLIVEKKSPYTLSQLKELKSFLDTLADI